MKKEKNKPKNIISISSDSSTVFEGWGTSLCWWAHRVGFSQKLTNESARLFFSEEGLNLNIMRYNIGGGDDPEHNHITRTDSEIPGWVKLENGQEVFCTHRDKNQLSVLKAAYEAAGEDAYVEAFSNSPPYFMTVSGCSSGGKNPLSNNLKVSKIAPFAMYLAKVCEYIQNDYGVKIKSLAPMNEPYTNYWKAYSNKQEGCHVSPGKMQSQLIIKTYEALKERGLNNIIVTASDETNTKRQLISLKKLSDEAMDCVGRVSTHTYDKATSGVARYSAEKGKKLWMSETDWSSISGENSGEMGAALWLSEKIIEDINTLSPAGWVIWQIIASYISRVPDEKGRFDLKKLPELTEGYWGVAFADIDNEEIYLTQKYYAMGQFSRYIRPGMRILKTKNKNILCAVSDNSLVVVAVNSQSHSEDMTVDFSSLSKAFKKAAAYRTGGSIKDGEHWTKLCGGFELCGNKLICSLKEHSVTTYILSE